MAAVVGICIGLSPLGNSRILKVMIMALTGGLIDASETLFEKLNPAIK